MLINLIKNGFSLIFKTLTISIFYCISLKAFKEEDIGSLIVNDFWTPPPRPPLERCGRGLG